MTGLSQPAIAFPALLVATEKESADDQKLFLVSRAVEFTALAVAAGFGAIPNDQWAGFGPVVALVLFAVALVVRASGVGDRAERRWYDARAASESIKSASWQFAVGGEAFRLSDALAETRFLQAQRDVLDVVQLRVPAPGGASLAIAPEMFALRSSALSDRRAAYLAERVEDQQVWYAKKATFNGVRAKRWQVLLVAVESVACLLGLMRVLDVFDVDWLGLLGTVAAGVAAWKQTKNYSSLNESYSVTSHEVTLLAQSMATHSSEDAWAQAVHDAEAAFSREHTLWLARRQGPRP